VHDTLTPLETAAIARELHVRLATRGSEILGSQLGKLINDIVQPRSVRLLGGLRRLADSDLRPYVVELGATDKADVQYEILAPTVARHEPTSVPEHDAEIAGQDLWRFFSNPNIECTLSVANSGQIFAAPLGSQTPPDRSSMARIDTDEYRKLAEEFLEQSTPEAAREQLRQTLREENFYHSWVTTLRRLRPLFPELAKAWEILRIEHVAGRLSEELRRSGVDPARAAQIAAVARPVSRPPRGAAEQAATPRAREPMASATRPRPPAGGPVLDDVEALRALVHRAVDVMSAAELRELRISAGTLLDASRRVQS